MWKDAGGEHFQKEFTTRPYDFSAAGLDCLHLARRLGLQDIRRRLIEDRDVVLPQSWAKWLAYYDKALVSFV